MKKNSIKKVARASEKVAILSCGKVSILDTYQPKLPKAVRKLKDQNNG